MLFIARRGVAPAIPPVVETLLQDFKRCAVIGGSVLRAVIDAPPGKDVDLFTWCPHTFSALQGVLMGEGWWEGEKRVHTSWGEEDGESPVANVLFTHSDEKLAIDLVCRHPWMSIEDVLASFDIDVARIFYTSRSTWATEETWDAIDRRELRVLLGRNTTPKRVERYKGLGFTFSKAVDALTEAR